MNNFAANSVVAETNSKISFRVGQTVRFHGAGPCDAKIKKMTPKGGVGGKFYRLTLETVTGHVFECDEWNVSPK